MILPNSRGKCVTIALIIFICLTIIIILNDDHKISVYQSEGASTTVKQKTNDITKNYNATSSSKEKYNTTKRVKTAKVNKKKNHFSKRVINTTIPLCPNHCNGINCKDPKCASCEFKCGDWTKECQGVIGKRNGTNECLLLNFTDKTKTVLQLDYFNNYPQMGRPRFPEYSPLFIDLTGDGVLDVFDWSHQEMFEVIESVLTKSNITTLRPLPGRVTHIVEKGRKLDAHGMNVIDLDGDGILDIYVAVGAGDGGKDQWYDDKQYLTRNILFWGELDEHNNTIFRGGQDEAEKAGIDMKSSRGRMNYVFDANGDGLIDIFCGTDRRVSNEITPGVLLINQGNRTWRKDTSMMEYSKVMIYTDVDGDGYANEFVIARDFCFPLRKGPDTDPNYERFGPFSEQILTFCSTRPVATTAVYKYNTTTQTMQNIGKTYVNISAANDKQPPCCPHESYYPKCCAQSLASADFDGDLIADHVFLYRTKMIFYYSSHRPKGTLPFGNQYISHTVHISNPNQCMPRAIRILDLDNDGNEEILIMCRISKEILVYTRNGDDWILNECPFEDLSKINETAAMTSYDRDLACTVDREHPGFYKITQAVCTKFDKLDYNLEAISVVDLNNDGYYDIVAAAAFGKTIFLYNEPYKRNRFIAFQIHGHNHGIGVTIILYAKNMCGTCPDDELVAQFREVSSFQHASDNQGYIDDRIIFGLGEEGVPVKLLVRWPNGVNQTLDLGDWVYSTELRVVEINGIA